MSIQKRIALLLLVFSFFGVASCADIRNYSKISSERNNSIVSGIDYYDLAYNVDVIVLPAEVKTKGNVDIDNNFVVELQVSNWGNAIKDSTQEEIYNSGRFIEFGNYSGRIEISTEISSVSISNAWGGIRSKCNVVYTYKDLVAGKVLSKHESSIEVMALHPAIPEPNNIFIYSFDQLTYAIAREAIVGFIRLSPIADIQLTQKQVMFYNSNIKKTPSQTVSYVPIDNLIQENKKELSSAFSIAKKMQEDSDNLAQPSSFNFYGDRNKNKSKVRVGTVPAPATPPLKPNRASNAPAANSVKSSENPVIHDSSQAATEAKKTDRSLRGTVSSERLKEGTVKNDEPSYDGSGYIAAPGRYQPQNKVETEQARAMDEWMEEEKAKLHGATGNAASRTGYTAAPGHYQPQNKVEAEQARAMDEWMEEQ